VDVTAVVPFKRGGNEAWLKQAVASLPQGLPFIVAENDGELADALNTAVEAAKTEFVIRLDADDALHPKALDFLVSASWDGDVCYPSLLLTDVELKPFEMRRAGMFCPNRMLTTPYFGGGSLIRREKLLGVGGYRALPILEDWDLFVRLWRDGARFKSVPEAVYLYRQHPGSRNKTVDPAGTLARMRQQIVGDAPDLAATFYYQATDPTTYWRCLLPARYLPGQAVDRCRPTGAEDIAFPEHRGAAVFQFPGDAGRALLMAELQEQGVRVLVESDDSYFERSPHGTPGWDTKLSGPNGHSFEAHRRMLPWVDGVVTTTPHLAKRYAKHTSQPVFVCPNQIDPADWGTPDKGDTVRIGWFASFSHRGDSELVRRALEWASGQDGVEVVTVGHDPRWDFPRTHVPWSNDLGVYRQLVGTFTIGLAPVVATPWGRCRSDLKALEYGISSVAPIVSDTTPYDTYTGPCLKAGSAKDFFNHVRDLVRNPGDARALAAAAREHVMAERTVDKNIWRWQEAVSG
jgi:hypothetical protein